MAIITLTLTRKPKITWNDKCKQQAKEAIDWFNNYVESQDEDINKMESNNDNFCPECGENYMVHNDDGSCIDDAEIETAENDETEDTEIKNEKPEPVKERTGKVTMLTENFAKCLNIVKDTAGNERSCIPIIRKVLIEFKNGRATFRTTNLETMSITSCGGKIESEFSCVLPFKILKDLSELLYYDVVTFEQTSIGADDNAYKHVHGSNLSIIKIIQGRNVCTLFDDDIQDYPPMPKIEGQSVVISELAEAIKKVKDKILPTKEYRHYEGLYFNLSKPEIVATDAYKMKIAKLECEPKPMQFRIDKECALLLAKFKDMDCVITSNDKTTQFDF
jgi:hypothetical protein